VNDKAFHVLKGYLMNWQDNRYSGWQGDGYGEQPRMRVSLGPTLSPVVRILIILNAVFFIADLIVRHWFSLDKLAYSPYYAIHHLYLWQFVTYMFLHAGVWHILLNMLPLWMFGSEVERRIGGKNFITIYLLCGIFGALFFSLSHIESIRYAVPVVLVGASGAVCGILVAFAMIFPERRITLILALFLPVTISAKYLVLGYFLIEVLNELSNAGNNIAHLTHLGGMVFAYFYMKFKFGYSLPFAFSEKIGWWFRSRFSRLGRQQQREKYKPIDSGLFISSEIDPILDKISKHGINSLTWRERRILKKARSKMK
jgi:membrane associated rhomboid family serine protease